VKAPLDLNLSFRLVDVLLPRFSGSRHVGDFGLTGDDDERIWNLAKEEGFVIVTKDNDFLARALVRGHPPRVVHICVGNSSTQEIAELLAARSLEIERFVTDNRQSVVMVRRK
jgi:predicted nuclease of predicted toxin-antitoxin system